jgi:hypothetical protein
VSKVELIRWRLAANPPRERARRRSGIIVVRVLSSGAAGLRGVLRPGRLLLLLGDDGSTVGDDSAPDLRKPFTKPHLFMLG